jgi:hypothetical protein
VSILALSLIGCVIFYLCKRKHKGWGAKDDQEEEEERVLEEMLQITIFGERPLSTIPASTRAWADSIIANQPVDEISEKKDEDLSEWFCASLRDEDLIFC